MTDTIDPRWKEEPEEEWVEDLHPLQLDLWDDETLDDEDFQDD